MLFRSHAVRLDGRIDSIGTLSASLTSGSQNTNVPGRVLYPTKVSQYLISSRAFTLYPTKDSMYVIVPSKVMVLYPTKRDLFLAS